jgi:pyrimidine and pyridine-specific 5'-nucleotidase
MQELIHKYFVTHLKLDDESADMLHRMYYRDFGLAIEGLVRFNHINALEYNKEVDDALPLDEILKPDPDLRKLIQGIDRTKVKKLWLFTNAYINHGKRVVRLLAVDDLFDGITYSDYSQRPMICKPQREAFRRAMQQAGATDASKCILIDDSELNIKGAKKMGWQAIHYVEDGIGLPDPPVGDGTVTDLSQLPKVLPQIFKSSAEEAGPCPQAF